ncbi:flagellar hook-associated protein 3 [Achromobacter aloeverae]|uniref:Flagellar hook-associated protein 3 n=1 Tax=Achromobacter aloeverae TaxID=1750518 RepID=A0A4Q1HQT5_9BURK|nr:flagellar hook-associated protein FlgL [Achromobacter aloeverae]RXN93448.1 flagellar hook-associated protein 3 [Achromobacter aloeverae]
MRLSTSMIYQSGLNGILNTQSSLLSLQQQVSSGRRIVTASDDPLAAGQSINASQNLSMTGNYASNRNVANTSLGNEGNALSAIVNNITAAMEKVVQAGNGTLSDTDRQTLATVLTNSRDALFALANSTDGSGQYLFSGYQSGSAAYVKDPTTGAITYAGDTGQRIVQVDQARQMATSDIGSDIFNRSNPGNTAYIASASSTNTGAATFLAPNVQTGGANIGSTFKIDFAIDATTGDTTYTITTTDSSGTSTTSTPVAYTPGDTIDMGGVTMTLSGAPADGDSFTVEPSQSANMDVFATMDQLITALTAPSQGDAAASASLRNTLTTAARKLAINLDNVSTVQASVGARQNELDALDSTGSQRKLTDTKVLSDLTDLDYYSAVSALTLRQVALQASMAAFSSIQGVSLFSMNK